MHATWPPLYGDESSTNQTPCMSRTYLWSRSKPQFNIAICTYTLAGKANILIGETGQPTVLNKNSCRTYKHMYMYFWSTCYRTAIRTQPRSMWNKNIPTSQHFPYILRSMSLPYLQTKATSSTHTCGASAGRVRLSNPWLTRACKMRCFSCSHSCRTQFQWQSLAAANVCKNNHDITGTAAAKEILVLTKLQKQTHKTKRYLHLWA